MAGKVTPWTESKPTTIPDMFGAGRRYVYYLTSDSPINIRTAIKESVLYRAANGVTRLKIPVNRTPTPKTSLPPSNFLAKIPPGSCVIAYPQKKDPRTIPWVLPSQSNSPSSMGNQKI